MGFVIHWHESAMELHVFPIPIPPPTSLSTRFLWVFPVHQAQALVSCIPPSRLKPSFLLIPASINLLLMVLFLTKLIENEQNLKRFIVLSAEGYLLSGQQDRIFTIFRNAEITVANPYIAPNRIQSTLHISCCAVLSCSVMSPWTVAHQAPLSMGILQARILEWVAMSSSRGSSQPWNQIGVSCIAGGFFTS